MKTLFLGIDGVINSEDYAIYRYYSKKFNLDEFIDERAVVESYVIIDDDEDMLPEQKNNFVHCNFQHGLTCVDVYKAIDILNNGYNAPVYL